MFLKQKTETQSPSLKFYSFSQTGSVDPITPRIDNESLYTSLLDITSLYSKQASNCDIDHLSIGYNFSFIWSLLDPVSGSLQISNKFLTKIIDSLFSPDKINLKKPSEFESNKLKLAQFFRVAFKLVDPSGLDEANLNILRQVSGGSTLEAPRIAFEFFFKFWTVKAAKTDDFDSLKDNIELLNYHVKLLQEKFFGNEDKVINLELGNVKDDLQLRNTCIEMVADLIKAYKKGYKEFIIKDR